MPLMIGVGVGAAFKYFLPVDEKPQTTFVPQNRVTSSVHTTTEPAPKISIELPTETNFSTKDKPDVTVGKVTTSTLDTDKEKTKEVGRPAGL